jgi:hypothetical protein
VTQLPCVYRKLSVSGRIIVTTLRTDGNQRYSWLETRRSLLVNMATAAQVQLLLAHQVYGWLGCNIRCGRCAHY